MESTSPRPAPLRPSAADAVAAHSPASDPGTHRALLAAVDPDPAALRAAATATIRHYRAEGEPTPAQLADIDRRTLASILDAAVERAAGPLTAPRAAEAKVGGCCRDHALLAVGVLREHGIPARSRLGFADYFTPGFRHDHVVVERWDDTEGRWCRLDPELAPGSRGFDVADLPTGSDAPFETAAEAWIAIRAGRADPGRYGVFPGADVAGEWFVHGYVIADVVHRFGTETLLWDEWGAMASFGGPVEAAAADLADRLARLTVDADAGDAEAEDELARFAESDARVRPGREVAVFSPSGLRTRIELPR
ncbi:transglutaminase-like domain-containing protein [Agromyces seonyuensis]|uniref:Transglutaminase domain-containing protein n=1 Tax=Agromyces seonyuensis TaxID=2662446 RepID=A0A6I4P1R1_9MICO|nr:transglutaminase-like domain-containing protein [Agromyces seonyuensis]MWB99482.1 transglutaminase domain-containing protein [Agromyces seonyuensis]